MWLLHGLGAPKALHPSCLLDPWGILISTRKMSVVNICLGSGMDVKIDLTLWSPPLEAIVRSLLLNVKGNFGHDSLGPC